jgi:hypothetical protein
MDRNRKAQVLGQERDKDNKQALGAVTAASDAKRSGGYPASTPPPCISFQTGECQRGKDCRYSHVRVSESELEDLKTRRSAFYQGIAEKGKKQRQSQRKRKGGHESSPCSGEHFAMGFVHVLQKLGHYRKV